VLLVLSLQRLFSANPIRKVDAFAALGGLGGRGKASALTLRVVPELQKILDDLLSAGALSGW
jgi:hypothetical protein